MPWRVLYFEWRWFYDSCHPSVMVVRVRKMILVQLSGFEIEPKVPKTVFLTHLRFPPINIKKKRFPPWKWPQLIYRLPRNWRNAKENWGNLRNVKREIQLNCLWKRQLCLDCNIVLTRCPLSFCFVEIKKGKKILFKHLFRWPHLACESVWKLG